VFLHTCRLLRAGLLLARRWKIPAGWKPGYLASDGSWIGFAPRARVLLVHTKSIHDAKDRPSQVSDLADPKWKGKCAVAFPMFGTTATHFAVLASRMGDQADSFLQAVAANALVLSGNKQVADAVASGQVAFGLTDTDDAQVAKEQGAPVEIIFPDQPSSPDDRGAIGTLFIPGTVAILKNAPHPIAAQWLADALIDQETEKRLTMALGSQFPIWPSGKEPASASPVASLRWMEVDFERAADGWETLAAKLRRWFAEGGDSKVSSTSDLSTGARSDAKP
jgi:iron(III) transport system substrate-binding protein